MKRITLILILLQGICGLLAAEEIEKEYRQYYELLNKCSPVEINMKWTPIELVKQYIEKDLSGIFIEGYESHVLNNVGIINMCTSYERQKMLLSPKGIQWQGPVIIVRDYAIHTIEVRDCIAWIGVTYFVVGEYDKNNRERQFYRPSYSEDAVIVLVNTIYGWRIVSAVSRWGNGDPISRPHLGIKWALTQIQSDSLNVEYLNSYLE